MTELASAGTGRCMSSAPSRIYKLRLFAQLFLRESLPARQPSATWLAAWVPAHGMDFAAGAWAEVQQIALATTGFFANPAAGDACIHLAALPGAGRRMGPTRPAGPAIAVCQPRQHCLWLCSELQSKADSCTAHDQVEV